MDAKRKALESLGGRGSAGGYDTNNDTKPRSQQVPEPQSTDKNGGDDETRTRDLCRDRAEITSTYNNLQGCWGLPSTCKDAVTGQITGWSSGWRIGKIPN